MDDDHLVQWESWEDLKPDTSIRHCLEAIASNPWKFAEKYSPKCEDYSCEWRFENGEIFGPPNSPVDNTVTAEQWTNRWVEIFHKQFGIQSIVPDAFYRFVELNNAKAEYDNAKKGEHCGSKNHNPNASGCKQDEPGKSIAAAPLWIYFKAMDFGWMLTGTVMDQRCSDGAPLLDVEKKINLVSPKYTVRQILLNYYESNKDVFERLASHSGVEEWKVLTVSFGLWDNYRPQTAFSCPVVD